MNNPNEPTGITRRRKRGRPRINADRVLTPAERLKRHREKCIPISRRRYYRLLAAIDYSAHAAQSIPGIPTGDQVAMLMAIADAADPAGKEARRQAYGDADDE